MNIFLKFFFCAFLMSVISPLNHAQSSDKGKCDSTHASNPEAYEGWQKIQLTTLEFYIPGDMKKIDVKCYEGGCHKFENESLVLTVDLDEAAFRPTFEKQFSSFKYEVTEIDGSPAWIWQFEKEGSYKNESPYRYISGVNFKFQKDPKIRMGIYLFSKKTIESNLAEKIFKSVRFCDQTKPK